MPKINGLLRFLQTMKFCLKLCAPKPLHNVKMPTGLMLLLLAGESLMPAKGFTLSMQYNFCRHFSLITDFEGPLSQNVEMFSIRNCNLKICCHFVIYTYLHDFLRRVFA